MLRPGIAAIALALVARGVLAAERPADWVRTHSIAFERVDAETPFDDLRGLNALIGNARIVALGEPTHGSREVFQMKHRLVEYLAKKKGFTIFAIEANMPEANRLDSYVLGGDGDARALISGMYFWTWHTEEVLAMVEWMRRFNAAGTEHIHFTGFDMQTPDVAMDSVMAFVQRSDPQYADSVKQFYAKVVRPSRARSPFGLATGTFPVDDARGKHVRYSGWIRTEEVQEGWAGLWWRADRGHETVAFDNLQSRGPRGTTPWTRYQIDLDVPNDATNINFGTLLPGKGTAWFDSLRIELDGVEAASKRFDLDFETAPLTTFGFVSRDSSYVGKLSTEQPFHGAQCFELRCVGQPGNSQQSTRSAEATASVVRHLVASRDSYVQRAPATDVDWAIQDARIVEQASGRGSAHRDSCMAANIAWILARDPQAKVIVWAHNAHVSRADGAMGQFLERTFPKQMVVLGFATSRGRYTAVGQGLSAHDLAVPPAESLEALLGTVGQPRMIVDLRRATPKTPAWKWFAESRPMRSIGAVATIDQFFPVVGRDLYDGIIYLETTTEALQLPGLAGANRKE